MSAGPERIIHLVVKDGPDKGKMFFLKSGKEAVIGRGPVCDLRLTDPGASAKHCVVRSAGDLVFIDDLNSRNGLTVNGDRTSGRCLDENGVIGVGTSTIELTWAETESAVPLSTVQSVGAPTLMEAPSKGTAIRSSSETQRMPSTMLSDTQMKDFRAARDMLGASVCGYLLLETLGTNDLGVVFRSKALKTKDAVALTLMPRTLFKTEELMDIFLKETRTDLEVPHCVRVHATGSDKNHVFIATDLVIGRDLDASVEAGRKFSAKEAVDAVLPICDALSIAHEKGVFYRDLRPNVIVLDGDNKSWLQMLGIGPIYEPEGKSIFTRKDDMRRLSFQSPELTLSKPATPACDVFSMGSTLYNILSGKRPFDAKTRLELVRKIRWEDPAPLGFVNKALPGPLVDVINKAMHKEASHRYQDMKSLAEALREAVKA